MLWIFAYHFILFFIRPSHSDLPLLNDSKNSAALFLILGFYSQVRHKPFKFLEHINVHVLTLP